MKVQKYLNYMHTITIIIYYQDITKDGGYTGNLPFSTLRNYICIPSD